PIGPDGKVVVGSGNSKMPCWRMQRAILRSLASVCSEGCVVEPGPGSPPPGRSLPHFACAALNVGEEMTSALAPKANPPSGLGSGKLDTPLARMHRANASAPGGPPPGVASTLATFDADLVAAPSA